MDKQNKENHIYASIGTLLFMAILFALLWWLGLNYYTPPPPEYGVEVNLGYSDQGMGDQQLDELSDMQNSQNSRRASSEEEQLQTQDDEETVSIASQKKKTKAAPVQKNQTIESKQDSKPVEEETPQLNPNALYPGKRTTAAISSQGNTNQAGDQGSQNGNPNANGGGGSGGGGGISFSLTGRTLKNLARPAYDSEEQGVVVVKIWVNQQGLVTRTQSGMQGTTTMDENLWERARQAAMRSAFTPDESAPTEQIGYISYKFIRSR